MLDRVRNIFEKDFVHSPLLAFRSSKRVLAGGLVLIYDSSNLFASSLLGLIWISR